MSSVWSFFSLINLFYKEVEMAKGKKQSQDINKIIASWKEKLSIAQALNKKGHEVESMKRMLEFWEKKKGAR